MTATDRLRALLDDRGVDWEAWNDRITVALPDKHYLEITNGTICAVMVDCNPEQAIEATLGRGTCKWEPADFITEGEWWKTSCGEAFTWEPDGTPRYCPNCGREVVE